MIRSRLAALAVRVVQVPRRAAVRGKAAFRWRYVLPRLAVVAALVAGVRFGLDPLLRYALVAGGEAALGAKVEIATLSTSLLDGELVVGGLAAANPQKPLRNLVEAEQVQLRLDFNALMHKRVVVTGGTVRGLRFDGARTTSGALAAVPAEPEPGPSLFDPLSSAATDAAMAWFDGLKGRIEDDLESRLATLRVVRELEERWQSQYAALRERADRLRATAKQIERDVREAKKNPLRHVGKLDGLQQQLAATQAELKATLAELKGLPAQAQADRKAVDAARRQDEQFLRETLTIAQTDGGKLSEYLLGETAHGYVAWGVGWVNAVRSWIPQTKMERPARARGTNVLFVDRRRPKFLVECVALAGTARLDGQPLEIAGELTNATTEPQLHDEPLRLHLVAAGAVGGELTATLDRRGDAPHDLLVLDCPELALGERTLGKRDALAVNVAAGAASLAAEVRLDGDELSGFVRIRQASTLTASTPVLRDDRIAEMIGESLRGVDRLEANVTLSGTLRRPRWQVESNLGPQLAGGIDGAVRRYLADRRDRLVAKVQGKVDVQLAKLAERRTQAQQELLAALGEDQQLVAQLGSLMGGGSLNPAAVPQIGAALNLDRLQR